MKINNFFKEILKNSYVMNFEISFDYGVERVSGGSCVLVLGL